MEKNAYQWLGDLLIAVVKTHAKWFYIQHQTNVPVKYCRYPFCFYNYNLWIQRIYSYPEFWATLVNDEKVVLAFPDSNETNTATIHFRNQTSPQKTL